MDLNTLWFLLVAVLFTGFFVLEGFDYGVGVLLPFVARSDAERRQVINTIGPVWDGNEVGSSPAAAPSSRPSRTGTPPSSAASTWRSSWSWRG